MKSPKGGISGNMFMIGLEIRSLTRHLPVLSVNAVRWRLADYRHLVRNAFNCRIDICLLWLYISEMQPINTLNKVPISVCNLNTKGKYLMFHMVVCMKSTVWSKRHILIKLNRFYRISIRSLDIQIPRNCIRQMDGNHSKDFWLGAYPWRSRV